jgi:hypothetical protein
MGIAGQSSLSRRGGSCPCCLIALVRLSQHQQARCFDCLCPSNPTDAAHMAKINAAIDGWKLFMHSWSRKHAVKRATEAVAWAKERRSLVSPTGRLLFTNRFTSYSIIKSSCRTCDTLVAIQVASGCGVLMNRVAILKVIWPFLYSRIFAWGSQLQSPVLGSPYFFMAGLIATVQGLLLLLPKGELEAKKERT